MPYDIFDWNKRDQPFVRSNFIKPGQITGDLDERNLLMIERFLGGLCDYTKQKAIVLQRRKRVIIIEEHRRKHRINDPLEVLVDVLRIGRRQRLELTNTESVLLKMRL